MIGKANSSTVRGVKLKVWAFDLKLAHQWTIATTQKPGGGGAHSARVLFVELETQEGFRGIGEAAPSGRYSEHIDSTRAFLESVDPQRLTLENVNASMSYVEGIAPGNHAAKGAINIALLDAAATKEGKALHDYLGLGFTEGKHVTSFSIGIDQPEAIQRKVAQAEKYPILKLKIGSPTDRENLAALRNVAPTKKVRVDANEAWKSKEQALEHLLWLAEDGFIEFVEQPMPANSPPAELCWLKERSPLPLMADEGYLSAADIQTAAACYHAVNVKLVKTGGISKAYEALTAARTAGLKTMIGCMIESSVLISAAAHLAELTDYLDIDGNLLITNDPFAGPRADGGIISFATAPTKTGLRVARRNTAAPLISS